MISAVCLSKAVLGGSQSAKTIASTRPALTTTIGKCLGIYSKHLSAQRFYYSILLSNGGLKDASINRLAKLYDCTTHQNLLPKLNAIADRYDIGLQQWVKKNQQFGIVFDNVDVYVTPRREI